MIQARGGLEPHTPARERNPAETVRVSKRRSHRRGRRRLRADGRGSTAGSAGLRSTAAPCSKKASGSLGSSHRRSRCRAGRTDSAGGSTAYIGIESLSSSWAAGASQNRGLGRTGRSRRGCRACVVISGSTEGSGDAPRPSGAACRTAAPAFLFVEGFSAAAS
jgi:hypothetical protein